MNGYHSNATQHVVEPFNSNKLKTPSPQGFCIGKVNAGRWIDCLAAVFEIPRLPYKKVGLFFETEWERFGVGFSVLPALASRSELFRSVDALPRARLGCLYEMIHRTSTRAVPSLRTHLSSNFVFVHRWKCKRGKLLREKWSFTVL